MLLARTFIHFLAYALPGLGKGVMGRRIAQDVGIVNQFAGARRKCARQFFILRGTHAGPKVDKATDRGLKGLVNAQTVDKQAHGVSFPARNARS